MANQTIYNCILERIRVAEPESVFVSTDYVDLADVNTVRQCLSRMEQTGELQRIMRGVYYRPVFSQLLGEYELRRPITWHRPWPGSSTGALHPPAPPH